VPSLLTRWVGDDVGRLAGVAHVAAVWARPDGAWAALRVGEGAPRTSSDAVVLSGARARADAIVTTGRILRDEPDLVHASIAPPDVTDALAHWRASLGLVARPCIAVLTGSGDLPMAHPALAAAERLVLFTGAEGAERLRASPERPGQAEIVEHARPSARSLLEYLRAERGARSILVEAGASTATPLYAAPAAIDELWLTVCLAPRLATTDVVGPFVEPGTVDAALGPPVHREQHEEGGLEWATLVFRRAART